MGIIAVISAFNALRSNPPASGQFQISSRRWQFIGKQMEGNYPNWRQVVPSNDQFATSITFDPEKLTQVIQTIDRMPCHDDLNFIVGVELIGRKVSLLGKSTNEGNWTKVEVTPVKTEGKEVTIFLNRHFFTKALKFGLNRLELIDALSPMRFSNEGRMMIVMPTRSESSSSPRRIKENDKGEAETVNSEADHSEIPTPAKATSKERTNMADQPGNGASNGPVAGNEFDAALADIESVKESLQESVTGLKSLSVKLKSIQREQKANVKEFNTVRQTLKSLQGVKL